MGNIVLLLMLALLLVLKISAQINLIPGQTCKERLAIRVVNGEDTTAQEAPWHAILERKKQSQRDRIVNTCGGSILSPSIILTAAHCVWQNKVHWITRDHLCPIHVRNQETARECHEMPNGCPEDCFRMRSEDLNVYVGVTTIRQSVRIPLEVKSIIIHPGWNKTSSKVDSVKSGNDLAIIVLQNKLYFSTEVNSICLPNDQLVLHSGQDVSVNGFGLKENDRSTKKSPAEILQRGDLQFKSKENCIADFKKVNQTEILQGDQICAYSTSTPPTDACQGDSGSGLLTFVESVPVLVGVVSFGHKKCKDLPGVYTNVQSHMDWIKQQWNKSANNEQPNLQHENSSTIDNSEGYDDYDDEETSDCEVGEEYANNCYLLVKSPLDWLNAASDCRARNGTLVTIENSGLNSFIANDITNGERTWISTNGPVWKWSDGEVIGTFVAGADDVTEFVEGEDRRCIYINYKNPGKWSNDYCGTALPYVCQGRKLLIGCGGGSHGIPCCPDYINGDGKGGRQKSIDFSPKTEAECQRSCKGQHPTSIGVTQTQDGTSKCYCEFGSPKLGGNTNKRKTCLFPTARTVQSYEEIDGISILKPSRTGAGVSSLGNIGGPVFAQESDYDFRSLDEEPITVESCPQTTCQVGDQCCNLIFFPPTKTYECPGFC